MILPGVALATRAAPDAVDLQSIVQRQARDVCALKEQRLYGTSLSRLGCPHTGGSGAQGPITGVPTYQRDAA